MATTQEHNQLIKVCFDGNKHLKKVLDSEEIRNMTMIEGRFPLTKLPVCGCCEGLALWSHGGQAICRKCGSITKNPITYSSYLAAGYDVDATGQTAKSALLTREQIAEQLLPDYERLGKVVNK